MNAKGIGEEIKDGTASVAKEAAKGFIRGVKEEVKDTFKRKTATDQNAPSADAPVLKVAVFADGRLTVNGTASTIEGLRESLRTLSEKHGVVWYYREAGQQEPPAVATDVMQAVIDAGLPIRLSSRPDYSDSIGLDGRPITK
jgi:hypothetical protein